MCKFFAKLFGFNFIGFLLLVNFAAGCKKAVPVGKTEVTYNRPAPQGAYFKTPFQTEGQFVVEAIVSDLAEEIYFAGTHQLPDKTKFSVAATEKGGSIDQPIYGLKIQLDGTRPEIKLDVKIDGPIWAPEVYDKVSAAVAVAVAVGLKTSNADRVNEKTLLKKLPDYTPATIETENEELSARLGKDFTNPELHEQAALLLGVFMLRECSGEFSDQRTPLSRMTAHLAMARLTGGGKPYGINGKVAEAVLLTLMWDEAATLDRLKVIDTGDAAVTPFVRTLRARATGDYRPLSETNGLTAMENVACYETMSDYGNSEIAWDKLSTNQQNTIDYERIANDSRYGVNIGHQLLAYSMNLEMDEIQNVYHLAKKRTLNDTDLVTALNELPEGCFSPVDSSAQVHVLDWGQWALFLQRELCHTMQANYHYMVHMWGVPDEAKDYAKTCDKQFSGLRSYPFVRRFNCSDVEDYHRAEDDGFKVTKESPQLVSADCWNHLCYKVRFAPLYIPSDNPHINEWHNHNPLPGTDYDLHPRLDHPSLVDRSDVVQCFERLHEIAPYDCRIIRSLFKYKYDGHPSPEVKISLYGDVLNYAASTLEDVAISFTNQPEQYQAYMLRAAKMDPVYYYNLAEAAIRNKDRDLAANYFDRATASDLDAIRVANNSIWRVNYYLDKGDTAKAKQIADFGADVYSGYGLEAEGIFQTRTSNYNEALGWYKKLDERYNDFGPLMEFCLRHESEIGTAEFAAVLNAHEKTIFPKGVVKGTLADFHAPPVDGVSIKGHNDKTYAAGLWMEDVIVAVNGVKIHGLWQYYFARDSKKTQGLDLIVWSHGAYHEIKANPPNGKFGVPFANYQSKAAQSE